MEEKIEKNRIFKYKQEVPLEERKNKSREIIQKYPDKVPIILEKYNIKEVATVSKTRYLCGNTLKIKDLEKIAITNNSDQTFHINFFTAEEKPLNSEDNIKDLYEKYKDKEDNYLYLLYKIDTFWKQINLNY